ncbi:hypothetical protein LTR50_001600 [Elasticomyces elasticus]|nr:hypothetical protein LTR50_001600 [Elasticomyces elasticus]
MAPKKAHTSDKVTDTGVDYRNDPLWRVKRLTPAQLLVHDVRLEQWRSNTGPMLEITERMSSSLVPQSAAVTTSSRIINAAEASSNPIEQQRLTALEEEYGWMHTLRLSRVQNQVYDPKDSAKCRWIHISSKFPEYLRGCLWALSSDDAKHTVASSLNLLDHCIQKQERFSKHGKYFSPFYQPLSAESGDFSEDLYPMLISVPFLDWTVNGPTLPLRFQIDKREGYHSGRASSHPLRSLLRHFYRLEDTVDREKDQVFNKHKPWATDRELDLKIRRWYGHHPTGLNVDELWILAVDPEHIVTFSSNQTWKSRWPPLQLSSRISDVSFRGIRNNFFASGEHRDYNAITHAIVCLSGAVGLMHRNFWTDMVLCLTDRYAGYLGHLQYRLYRAPSTKLVMDLLQVQEELNIIIQITQQQLNLIGELQSLVTDTNNSDRRAPASPRMNRLSDSSDANYEHLQVRFSRRHQATYRQLSSSNLSNPVAQLFDNLQRELADLEELRDNTNNFVTRTIQLVNIRLEDHGKAILVFTIVTIIFLPLNFVTSFFGMNVSDIRNTTRDQRLFWVVAACVTGGVVSGSVFLAFSGNAIWERFVLWKEGRRDRRVKNEGVYEPVAGPLSFRVLDVSNGTS